MIVLNMKISKLKLLLAVLVCCAIFNEKSCNAQFHWAKSGRREADLLKEILQDLVKDSDDLENEHGVSYKMFHLTVIV